MIEKTLESQWGTKTASSSGGKYSNPGDTVTYTITVKNKGTKDITTSVIDELPEALENITCTDQENAVIENGIIKWDNVTLKAGQTIVYTVTGKVKENTNSSISHIFHQPSEPCPTERSSAHKYQKDFLRTLSLLPGKYQSIFFP